MRLELLLHHFDQYVNKKRLRYVPKLLGIVYERCLTGNPCLNRKNRVNLIQDPSPEIFQP